MCPAFLFPPVSDWMSPDISRDRIAGVGVTTGPACQISTDIRVRCNSRWQITTNESARRIHAVEGRVFEIPACDSQSHANPLMTETRAGSETDRIASSVRLNCQQYHPDLKSSAETAKDPDEHTMSHLDDIPSILKLARQALLRPTLPTQGVVVDPVTGPIYCDSATKLDHKSVVKSVKSPLFPNRIRNLRIRRKLPLRMVFSDFRKSKKSLQAVQSTRLARNFTGPVSGIPLLFVTRD